MSNERLADETLVRALAYDERQSGATSHSERTCPIKPAGALRPSRDAAIAMVRQADVGPKHRALAAPSRRRSSVARCPEEHADLPEATPMLAEARLDLCVLFLLVASPKIEAPRRPQSHDLS